VKILFRDYLASLRERDELDAVLPDLLSELGYTVYSRPQRGTSQAGVDIAAIGRADDGERKIYLFSVKQGDLTRQSWDGSPQALRSSLNEIRDNYIPTRIPKAFERLKVVICLVFGGDMQEQVRISVTGYMRENSTDRISFEEWNGDKLAGLLLQGVLREEIMPKATRSHFQKAVAMVDEPDIAVEHFGRLVYELSKEISGDRQRLRVVRQLYIALWVLFVWARDANNVEAPYRASEIVLLNVWNLLRPFIGKDKSLTGKGITEVLHYTIQLHMAVGSELLERKILPHVGVRDGISLAVWTRTHVDVNLKLFDLLGRISMTALWVYWWSLRDPEEARRKAAQEHVTKMAVMVFQMIDKNRALFLPLQDQAAIEISIFLILLGVSNANMQDLKAWFQEMVERLVLTVQTHGRYPCVFTEYRQLVDHPRERTEDYREEATAGSILIPLLGAFLSALGHVEPLEALAKLVTNELKHCTLQLWLPDDATEDAIYVGGREHGVALCDLSVTSTGEEPIRTIRKACEDAKDFTKLSAVATDYWPILLVACRHYRFPVPPQMWIGLISRPESASPSDTAA
jgi:hypothetical protein